MTVDDMIQTFGLRDEGVRDNGERILQITRNTQEAQSHRDTLRAHKEAILAALDARVAAATERRAQAQAVEQEHIAQSGFVALVLSGPYALEIRMATLLPLTPEESTHYADWFREKAPCRFAHGPDQTDLSSVREHPAIQRILSREADGATLATESRYWILSADEIVRCHQAVDDARQAAEEKAQARARHEAQAQAASERERAQFAVVEEHAPTVARGIDRDGYADVSLRESESGRVVRVIARDVCDYGFYAHPSRLTGTEDIFHPQSWSELERRACWWMGNFFPMGSISPADEKLTEGGDYYATDCADSH